MNRIIQEMSLPEFSDKMRIFRSGSSDAYTFQMDPKSGLRVWEGTSVSSPKNEEYLKLAADSGIVRSDLIENRKNMVFSELIGRFKLDIDSQSNSVNFKDDFFAVDEDGKAYKGLNRIVQEMSYPEFSGKMHIFRSGSGDAYTFRMAPKAGLSVSEELPPDSAKIEAARALSAVFADFDHLSAVDENGKIYDGFEKVVNGFLQLRSVNGSENLPPRLYVYEPGSDYPHAFEMGKDGSFLASEAPISPSSALTEFKNVPSNKVRDILKSYIDFDNLAHKYTEYDRERDKYLKYVPNSSGSRDRLFTKEKELRTNNDEEVKILREELKKENEDWKGKEDNKPVEPKPMTFGSKLKLFFVKFFTFGIADTAENRDWKEFKRKNAQYESDSAHHDSECERITGSIEKRKRQIENGIQKEFDGYKKIYDDCGAKQNELLKQLQTACESVNQYQSRMEVRIEGVRDLMKNKKTTLDNLSSKIWLLQGSLQGEPVSEKTKKMAAEYILCRQAKEQVDRNLKKFISDQGLEKLVENITSKSSVEHLKNSDEFNKIIGSFDDNTIDVKKLDERSLDFLSETDIDSVNPVKRLKDARDYLIKNTADKVPSDNDFQNILKLNFYDKAIVEAERMDYRYDANRIFKQNTVQNPNMTKEMARNIAVKNAQTDLEKSAKRIITDLVSNNLNNADAKTEEVCKRVEKHIKAIDPKKQICVRNFNDQKYRDAWKEVVKNSGEQKVSLPDMQKLLHDKVEEMSRRKGRQL